MQIHYFRLDELTQKEALHCYHWLIFGKSCDCKIMFKYTFGVSHETMVNAHEIVAILSDSLRPINSIVECILE